MFSAVRVKCNTIMILVKEVIIMISVGASEISVSVIRIRSAPLRLPFPLSYVTVTELAMLSFLRSSAESEEPGCVTLVLFSLVPVRLELTPVVGSVVPVSSTE